MRSLTMRSNNCVQGDARIWLNSTILRSSSAYDSPACSEGSLCGADPRRPMGLCHGARIWLDFGRPCVAAGLAAGLAAAGGTAAPFNLFI